MKETKNQAIEKNEVILTLRRGEARIRKDVSAPG